MKKAWLAVLLVFTLAVTGCAQNGARGAGDLMSGIRGNDVTAGDTAADTTDFAVGLLKNTYTGKNTVVSPASAYLALAMTANGALGTTLGEFEQVLGADLDALNDTGKILLDAFNKTSDGVTIKAADGIWYNLGSAFEPDAGFLQANADYYDAAARSADFSKQAAIDDINEFISENTNGLIENMLKQLEEDTVMVLVNTLYFNGKWHYQFDPGDTSDRTFTLTGGEEIRTPMMVREYDAVRYIDSDGARGIILPYRDGRYAYVAVLPGNGVADYMSALTGADFDALVASASEQNVVLYMPKYEVKGSYDLNAILGRMGLRTAFDPANADFSAMGTASDNIYIGRVLQNTVFKLGEEGTEAAAATIVAAEDGCAMPEETQPIELRLDRPFVYALMDMETMTPLFIGVLENPAE